MNENSFPTDLRELIESSVEPETVERNCEVNNNIYQLIVRQMFGNLFYIFHSIQVTGCRHKQARQSRRLTAMPRVLLVYLKRMAWAANKGDGEQEGKNIKVLGQ